MYFHALNGTVGPGPAGNGSGLSIHYDESLPGIGNLAIVFATYLNEGSGHEFVALNASMGLYESGGSRPQGSPNKKDGIGLNGSQYVLGSTTVTPLTRAWWHADYVGVDTGSTRVSLVVASFPVDLPPSR